MYWNVSGATLSKPFSMINSNMRCIETNKKIFLPCNLYRLIVTWDVLKHSSFGREGTSKLWLIVTWDVLKQ